MSEEFEDKINNDESSEEVIESDVINEEQTSSDVISEEQTSSDEDSLNTDGRYGYTKDNMPYSESSYNENDYRNADSYNGYSNNNGYTNSDYSGGGYGSQTAEEQKASKSIDKRAAKAAKKAAKQQKKAEQRLAKQQKKQQGGGFAGKAVKFVAAAVLFGVIAGGVMIGLGYYGYDFYKDSTDKNVSRTKTSTSVNADVMEETETETNVNTSEDGDKKTTGGKVTITDVSDIVDEVMPSVVAITSTEIIQSAGNDFWSYFYGNGSGSGQQYESQGAGSGIIVGESDTELLIVTNQHVVSDADSLSVQFVDGKSVEATVRGENEKQDIAVISIPLNKIDKESANVERVKQELVEYELIAEDWGGSTVFCPVSAHTKEGLDNLLEMILLTAEVLELKANPNRKARGIVIEAELDKGRGPVATVLVQKGTLKIGDSIAVGSSFGRVRAMLNDKGQNVKEAGPSQPVEILGLNGVPAAGEIFVATKNEKEARSMAETYIACDKEKLLAETKAKMSLDDLFSQIQAGNVKELNLVVKADVQGSVEAVKQSLLKLSNEEVVIKVIHAGVGAINESDVILASASNAIIIGFNVRPDVQAKDVAEREKVDLRLYKVIYNAIEDIEAAMKGMLDPIFEEQVTGHLVVRQTFKASGVGTIAGSFVLDGVIRRSSSVRVTRDGEQIYEGALASLKRFKDDVKEVKNGFECGIVLENFNDLKEDDQIEAYEMVEVPR